MSLAQLDHLINDTHSSVNTELWSLLGDASMSIPIHIEISTLRNYTGVHDDVV